MLILTRRVGEKLRIGDNIEIEILSVNGRQIRLGINAPKQVSVHREEIYKKIQEEKKAEKEEEKANAEETTISVEVISGSEEGRE